MKKYDAVIVGGGVVGATLALVLARLDYHVLLIEKAQKKSFAQTVDVSASRTFALSYSSKLIYSQLEIWPKLQEQTVPIEQVWVTVKGQYGSSRLTCADHHLPALGYVVGAAALEKVLYQTLSLLPQVEIAEETTVVRCIHHCTHWELHCMGSSSITVQAALLVGADGMHSPLRKQQQIGVARKNYGDYAMIANVKVQDAPAYIAIERFLNEGAVALLPWQNNYATCVWTMKEARYHALKEVGEEEWLSSCQAQLGTCYGKLVSAMPRLALPLQTVLATSQRGARFLLIGNAAHSLHPIAAQGLNLSLRDIWQWRMQLRRQAKPVDLGSELVLHQYIQARRFDQQRITFITDKIARLMAAGPLSMPCRALGITLFDSLFPVKHWGTQLAMGMI